MCQNEITYHMLKSFHNGRCGCEWGSRCGSGCGQRIAFDELKVTDFCYQNKHFLMNFWCQVGSFSTSGGGPEHLGRVLGGPGEALGRPWVPKGDFEASWEAPLGASWPQNVKKLM